MLEVVGITESERPVVKCVYHYVETRGLPLEVILSNLDLKGIVVSWEDYILDARKNGASDKTIENRVIAAVGDVFGRKYREQFEPMFKMLLERSLK